ncbi:uncharacterized protein LOC115093507 [Rhinatrema bivittatum]|uniref:uncharacterized protein LOC115093507 n=1 Tax=Rhinatrema bivittatum TaxID=194408 RepID=UPI0011294193|nr:uncharacterized protein LOC115093507 [Rhinatrema bivittatum]
MISLLLFSSACRGGKHRPVTAKARGTEGVALQRAREVDPRLHGALPRSAEFQDQSDLQEQELFLAPGRSCLQVHQGLRSSSSGCLPAEPWGRSYEERIKSPGTMGIRMNMDGGTGEKWEGVQVQRSHSIPREIQWEGDGLSRFVGSSPGFSVSHAEVESEEYPGTSKQEAWRDRAFEVSEVRHEAGRRRTGVQDLEKPGLTLCTGAAETVWINSEFECAWVVGHSFVHWAQHQAQQRPYGADLQLEKLQWKLCWMGKRGMKWSDLLSFLQGQIDILGVPKILLIHLGGNEIGKESCRALLSSMRKDIASIMTRWPSIKLGWSDIIIRFIFKDTLIWKNGVKKLN